MNPKILPALLRALAAIGLLAIAGLASARAAEPCRVVVTERGSGWPVSLVELRTTHNVSFYTDNAGVIALDAPEIMGVEDWFYVNSPGYEMPADGFGYRGVRLRPEPGRTLKVEVVRTSLARRIGRLTGAGLFAESQKTGAEPGWREAGVWGCDSLQSAIHGDRLFWLWGDTTLAHYPLGVFDSCCATTPLKPFASFEPPLRPAFDYFRDKDGRPRGVAKMAGSGPTWLSGMVDLPDQSGQPHLVASYAKIKGPLEAYERGLCVWNEAAARFDHLKTLWTKTDASPRAPVLPDGHAAHWTDEAGHHWVLFGNPLPNLRCPATFEALQDPAQWQRLTPSPAIPRIGDGAPVKPHSGSIAWNGWRKRWVTVFMESRGKPSVFGEIWYAEAPAPEGPWAGAVKVLSHANHTFYNPRLHPELTPSDSPILLFEGTYTSEFADHAPPTPRYDYNQILYRIDLDDPAFQAALAGKH